MRRSARRFWKGSTKKLEQLGCFARERSAIGPKDASSRRTSERATTIANGATTDARATDIHATEVCKINTSVQNFDLK